MSLQFFRSSPNATIPTKGSDGAAGWDLYSSEAVTLAPCDNAKVRTNLHVAFPKGYYARIASRSGLAYNHKVVTHAGVLDEDYRGEIGVVLFNHGRFEHQVNKGDRIAQLILEKIAEDVKVEEVNSIEELGQTKRGHEGFGSTDTHTTMGWSLY